jgi:hypothetical protein
VSKLNPGRELDALIAEKVMGLRVTWEDSQEEDGKDDPYILDDNGNYKWSSYVPYYSTSIQDAWLVVGKMRELGFYYSVGSIIGSPATGVGITELHAAGFGIKHAPFETVQADTAPHAICLAALKAVGFEMEG